MSANSDDGTVTLSFGGVKISLIPKKSNDQKSYLPFESLFKQTITNNNNPPGCKNSVSVRHVDGNTPGIFADLECFSGTLEISFTCELTGNDPLNNSCTDDILKMKNENEEEGYAECDNPKPVTRFRSKNNNEADTTSSESCDYFFSMKNHTPTVFYNSFSNDSFRLHKACAHPNTNQQEILYAIESYSDEAIFVDENGDLPIHILSRNAALISTESGRKVLHKTCLALCQYNPQSFTTKNANGDFPFIDQIHSWVNDVHLLALQKLERTSSSEGLSSIQDKIRNLKKHIKKPWDEDMSLSYSNSDNNICIDNTTEIEDRNKVQVESSMNNLMIPSHIPASVYWVFSLLSAGLKKFDELEHSGIITWEEKLDIRNALASALASIPCLVKTILLINDFDRRKEILNMTITRRVILEKDTVGKWIVSMLRRKTFSPLALEYFDAVSKTKLECFAGSECSSGETTEKKAFRKHCETVYLAIEKFDKVIIPTILLLPDELTEHASLMPVIDRLVYSCLTKPIIVALVLLDTSFLVFTMMLFNASITNLYKKSRGDTLSVGGVTYIPSVFLLNFIIHEVFRKSVEYLNLYSISLHALLSHIQQGATIIELLTLIFICVSNEILKKDELNNSGAGHAWILAITSNLLWLKVLLVMKNNNMYLALFIISLIEIIKDARWFLVFLLIMILLFGDMLRILVIFGESNADLCPNPNPNPNSFMGNMCKTNSYPSWMATYDVLLGNIELSLDNYGGKESIRMVVVVFTIIGYIVLMNVFIAVVSDSYERTKFKTKRIYGCARLRFAAVTVAFEAFIRPHPNFAVVSNRRFATMQFLRVLTLVVVMANGCLACVEALDVFAGHTIHMNEGVQIPFMYIVALVSFVLMTIANLIFVQRSMRVIASFFTSYDCVQKSCLGKIVSRIDLWVQSFFDKFLTEYIGFHNNSNRWEETRDAVVEDDWEVKRDCLEYQTSQIVNEAEVRINENLEMVEMRLKKHESKERLKIKEDLQKIIRHFHL